MVRGGRRRRYPAHFCTPCVLLLLIIIISSSKRRALSPEPEHASSSSSSSSSSRSSRSRSRSTSANPGSSPCRAYCKTSPSVSHSSNIRRTTLEHRQQPVEVVTCYPATTSSTTTLLLLNRRLWCLMLLRNHPNFLVRRCGMKTKCADRQHRQF